MAGLGLHSLPWTSCSEAIERLISARIGWFVGWSLAENAFARDLQILALNLTIVRPRVQTLAGTNTDAWKPIAPAPSGKYAPWSGVTGTTGWIRTKPVKSLTALWDLITTTIARDVGGGAYRLDFRKAAISRLETAWICPVTRRIFCYSPAWRSPYDPNRLLVPVCLPRLPVANKGGLIPINVR